MAAPVRNFKIQVSALIYDTMLPENFKFLKKLGSGCFGNVIECLKKDTNQIVAVKIPRFPRKNEEVPILERLMCLNLDQKNIVQFLGSFYTFTGRALVFEPLAISLSDYMKETHWAPMLLRDIRDTIQQLATALDALKRIGVIHGDLKPDNVMIMVNDGSRPLRIKLIDFGRAIERVLAKQGMSLLGALSFSAPDFILGLPITEAVDMWSLGCLTAFMLHAKLIFYGMLEFEVLHQMCGLLGQPKDHVLNAGVKTKNYFRRTRNKSWELKTIMDLGQPVNIHFRFSLKHLRKVRREKENRLEAVQRKQCVKLLKRMLCLDWSKRITPSQILTHPFIRPDLVPTEPPPSVFRIRLQSVSDHESILQLDTDGEISEEAPAALSDIKTETSTPSPNTIPPGVILVRPADPKNRLQLDTDVEISEEAPAALSDIKTESSTPSPTTIPPGVILVRPANPENRRQLDTDGEISEEAPAALSDIKTETSTPSPTTIPPGVILVRPANPENRRQLDTDVEISEEAPAALSDIKTETSTPSRTTIPPGVILVRPANPENRRQLDTDGEISEEAPAALSDIKTESSTLSRTTIPPGVILAWPAAAEKMEDEERAARLPAWLNSDTTSEGHDGTETQNKTAKKKKNIFSRFFSWLKKNSCCTTAADD